VCVAANFAECCSVAVCVAERVSVCVAVL